MRGGGLEVSGLNEIAGALASLATVAAIVAGGIWTYLNFGWRREGHPKIQFDVSAEVIGRSGDGLLLEVTATVKNLGLVRHRIMVFWFNLFILKDGADMVLGGPKLNNQVKFEPHLRRQYWMGKGFRTFVDPGVEQVYRHATVVPADTAFVIVKSQFRYHAQRRARHTAQKALDIRQAKA